MAQNDLPSPSSPNFSQRVRETLMVALGRTGDPLDRSITVRDLLDGGIAKLREGFSLRSGMAGSLPLAPSAPEEEPDLTPPPQPTGFTVTAAISHVFIEHDPPIYPQGRGHLRTRVYGSIVEAGDPLPTFADAVEVGQFSGQVLAMPSNPSTTWRLWVKWETNDGVLSPTPAGGTNGLEAVTGQDVGAMVKAMTGPGNPFTILTVPTTIDGFTYPAGTYSVRSFVLEQQVGRSQIRDLAVDDAKIASLSADKFTSGSIAVGQYIQSSSYVAGSQGWRINGDGTAEFGAASIRGQLTAAQIDTRGLSIKDANGNIIFAAGTPLSTANISGLGSLATQNGVSTAQVSGLGTLATQNNVSTSQVSGLGALATQNGVSTAQVSGLGLFATAPQLTSGNISTYIASAAIDLARINTASIGSLSALSATIGLLRTANTGQRTEIADNVIRVYDSSNVLRVKLGNLS